MGTSPAIATALAEVGPRLKRVRARRGVTLTELAAATGISKSTLSRLETGPAQAQPRAAPTDRPGPPGAPRRAGRRTRGRRPQNPAQAAKTQRPHRRPPDPDTQWHARLESDHPARARRARAPHPRGHEWLYVLSGQMRLILGRPRHHHGAGRGRRVRHQPSALVRPGRRSTRRDPQPARQARRAHPRPRRPTPTRPTTCDRRLSATSDGYARVAWSRQTNLRDRCDRFDREPDGEATPTARSARPRRGRD